MKALKTIFMLLSAMLITSTTFSADLIVEENGILPNFSSIQSAVIAASAGDRIYVKNKSGGIPYQENVTIDKPLSLLPWDANGQYLVFGSYTISPNGANFTHHGAHVTIVGMINTSGSINATSNNSTGLRLHMNVMGCQLNSGSLNISGTGWVSNIAGNWLLSGSITTRESSISGNLVNGSITINDAAGYGVDSGPLYIVGNRITTNTGGVTSGRIMWSNNDHLFHMANNHVRSNSTTGLIRISSVLAGSPNLIENNTLESTSSSNNPAIEIATSISPGVFLKIVNNAGHDTYDSNDTGTEYFLEANGNIQSGSSVEISYNVYDGYESFSDVSSAYSVIVGNTHAPTTYDPDDVSGVCSAPECINSGHPGTDYTDHDLSRNDRGVSGGSFNYNNFWPILTGGARVYMVKTPRTVVQSATIDAEADGYDR